MTLTTYTRASWALLALMLSSCLPSSQGPPPDDLEAPELAASTPPPEDMDSPASPCIPRHDELRSPRSIAQAMELINTLPKPLTLPCFITALARPMRVNATRGQISAQPAREPSSPRVFIFFEPLVMSITLAGEPSSLLEFGELDGQGHSIKGELVFPVHEELPASAPYDHVIFNELRTTCGLCHAQERVAFEIDDIPAYTSMALRPVDRERVSIDVLYREQMTCDDALEPRRCALLDALCEGDALSEGYFPADLPTFY